ncbi:MAG: hypothetical protein JEY79_01480 [Pseudodesulfovibrio sp.]|nr:hypothetical protein [Pseudodesulfovibrio sp.]
MNIRYHIFLSFFLVILVGCSSDQIIPQKTIYVGRFSVNIPEHWRITGWSAGSFQDVMLIKSKPDDLSALSDSEQRSLLYNQWKFLSHYESNSKIISHEEITQSTKYPAIATIFRHKFITRRGGTKLRSTELDTICAIYVTPNGLVGLHTKDEAGVARYKLIQKLELVLRAYRFGTPPTPSSQYFVTRRGYFDMPPKKVPKKLNLRNFSDFDEKYYCDPSGTVLSNIPESKVSCRVETKVVPQPKPYRRRADVIQIILSIRKGERTTNGMQGWEDVYLAKHHSPREEDPPHTTLILRWHFPGKAFSAQQPCIDISFETEDFETIHDTLAVWDMVVNSLHPSTPFKP